MVDLIARLRALSRHEHSDYSIGDEAADALEAAQWQPIDTAPKDGRYVLLTDSRYAPRHLIARWDLCAWWGRADKSGGSTVWREATHWMPLPAPPKEARNG